MGIQIACGKGQFWGFLMPIGFYGDCQYIRSGKTYPIRVRKVNKISIWTINR